MSKEKRTVALFDFDNTISRGDSVVPFLLYARKKGLIGWRHILKACGAFLLQKVDKTKTVRAKEISFSFLKGKTEAEMTEFMHRFWEEALIPRIKPAALAELQMLRKQGTTVLVVSASADAYMRLLPEYLPVDTVLSTHCLKDDSDRYTGSIESNCRGEEKVRRLQEWFASQSWAPDLETSSAYGDSAGDQYMLSMVGHPVWVDAASRVRCLVPGAQSVDWRKAVCRSET